MRNILHVPQKEKESFAARLKEIWAAPTAELARRRAEELAGEYGKRFPKAIEILVGGLENSLAFYAFPELDARKISSTNMLERPSREIRRRRNVVGIFPNPESYLRLVATYLMEYPEERPDSPPGIPKLRSSLDTILGRRLNLKRKQNST